MTKISIDRLTKDMGVGDDGRIKRCTGSEATAQLIEERILTVQTEWFMDLSQGLPWFTTLTGRCATPQVMRGYISAIIIQTPGVKQLVSVEISRATAARKIGVQFKYKDIYGITINRSL